MRITFVAKDPDSVPDNELLVFLVFAGNGLVVDRPARTAPDLIARCRASFEAAWALSIPHHDYMPVVS